MSTYSRTERTHGEGSYLPVDISPVRYARRGRKSSKEHGTENRYVNGPCRCGPCREAHRKARARRELLKQRGIPLTVPAETLRPRLEKLLAGGWTAALIGEQAYRHVAAHILAGRPVKVDTARRLLALPDTPPGGRVPSDLTMRRIGSLRAAGYTTAAIRAAAGLPGDAHFKTGHPYVFASTAAAIRDAYQRIGDTPGPSKRAAQLARARGLVPPAGWDDPGTLCWPADVEQAGPVGVIVDEVAVRRRLAGDRTVRLSVDERRAAFTIGQELGMSRGQVAVLVGVSGQMAARLASGEPVGDRPGPAGAGLQACGSCL